MDKEQVRKLIKEGFSHRQIQKETGLALATISKIRNERPDCFKAVVFNDSHIPYEDVKVLELILDFTCREKPDMIAILGDFVDFYSISRFATEPDRANSLQEELDRAVMYLSMLRSHNPKAEIVYVQGNHEKRLTKYMWTTGRELSCLRSLKLPELLQLDKLNIRYEENGFWLGNLFLTHGSIVRKHASYTAKGELDKNGCNGISGHTHRDGKHTVRNRNGSFVWYENYCTCELDPEYIDGIANWSQGFSVVTTIGDDFYVEQVHVKKSGKYIYGGKVYK